MSDKTSSLNKSDADIRAETSADGVLRRWVIVHHASVWRPPTDVYEHDGRLIVMVEIAGMRDSDFKVMLQGERLVISGVRQRITATDCAYHQMEILFGEFRTEVGLPWAVLRDEVSAVYRDGLLRIELIRAPAQQVHIVNVDTSD